MNQYRYERSMKDVQKAPRPIIFLAGPTVRGNQPHLVSWRFKAIEEFEKMGFAGSLIIPEFTSKTESDKGKDWIVYWENKGLSAADRIMFWIPRTRELIGLNTNFEFGYWIQKDPAKVIYGRPNDFFRNQYLDLMWEITFNNRRPIYKTLEETVKAVCVSAKKSLSYSNPRLISKTKFLKELLRKHVIYDNIVLAMKHQRSRITKDVAPVVSGVRRVFWSLYEDSREKDYEKKKNRR